MIEIIPSIRFKKLEKKHYNIINDKGSSFLKKKNQDLHGKR